MLIIISPAKTLDFKVSKKAVAGLPEFLEKAENIAGYLKKYSPAQLEKLMDISPKLAELNADRFAKWDKSSHSEEGRSALLVYRGDVYQGMQAQDFDDQEFEFAAAHLRIISGLYGVLRPSDLILPYRLDMGTKLGVGSAKDLYAFWSKAVSQHLRAAMDEINAGIMVNLASEEYFKAVNNDLGKAEIITPVFKDFKNGSYRIISFFAKKARGSMSRFIIKNRLLKVEELKLFNDDGYFYNDAMSEGNSWVFTRG
jgi:uncharacterized protein